MILSNKCSRSEYTFTTACFFIVFLLSTNFLHAQSIDLLLKGGHVIDPKNEIDSPIDVAITDGKISHVAINIPANTAKRIVDVSGLYVTPFVFEAQKKGIIFDVGHGGGAFAFSQAIPALEQGFKPNSISTDFNRNSKNGAMKDLLNVMSKFMAMGMDLQTVIKLTTMNPAKEIKREELGNLSVGSEADIAVFNLKKGDFGFMDVRRTKIKGIQKLEAELTIRAGKIVWDLNGLSVPPWIKQMN